MMTYHSTTIGCPSRFRAEENCKEENMECGPAVDRKNVRLTKTHIASIAKCMVLRHPRNTESRMHPPQHPKQPLLPVFFFVVGLACAIYLYAFNPIHACTVSNYIEPRIYIHTQKMPKQSGFADREPCKCCRGKAVSNFYFSVFSLAFSHL